LIWSIIKGTGETFLTPGQVVQEFLLDLHKGGKNISKFVFISEKVARRVSEIPLGGGDFVLAAVIGSQICATGISKISILEETGDEGTARVKAKIVCRDGSAQVKNYLLVARFGSWKIDFESLGMDSSPASPKAKEEKEKDQTKPRHRSRRNKNLARRVLPKSQGKAA
jgi:hypothetical protein